ncbi:MAG: hypothetical protein VR68_14670 [Peptococcaceae bacterium BRH_c4a]|nr:MAG: hypothetical protein VR68_14670 [Peptococcaceae bacterium BRH_c4a]
MIELSFQIKTIPINREYEKLADILLLPTIMGVYKGSSFFMGVLSFQALFVKLIIYYFREADAV